MAAHRKVLAFALGVSAIRSFSAHAPYMANIDPSAFRNASNDPAMVNAMRSIAESMINGNPGGCLSVLNRSIYPLLVNER